MHNRRDYEKFDKPIPSNIDVSKSSENITFVDRDIRQAYGEFFGKALAEYNDKQKRADRRIEDYVDHIAKSKNGEKLFYEDVVQWGEKKDFESPEVREKAKAALVKYIEGWQERNPNLRLIGAYLHMDEASPHLHIDYVPVATGYSRGLAVRNSLDRAMKEMGICPTEENRKNNATKMWKETEREYFGRICRELGLEVEQERKSNRKNLSVEEYKEARDEMFGELEQEYTKKKAEKDLLESEVKDYRELNVSIENVGKGGKQVLPGVTVIKTKELDTLKEQAKAYTANKDELADVRLRSDTLRSKELEVEQKLTYLDKRIGEVNKSYDEQLNLNRLYHELQNENKKLKSTVLELDDVNKALNAELGDLRAGIGKLKENFNRELQNLKTRLLGAYKALTSVVKAVGMLKYDKEDGYMVEGLTKKQDRLIDGVAEYAVQRAKAEGLHDLAGDMEKHIGISAELAPHVKVKDDRKHNHDNHER